MGYKIEIEKVLSFKQERSLIVPWVFDRAIYVANVAGYGRCLLIVTHANDQGVMGSFDKIQAEFEQVATDYDNLPVVFACCHPNAAREWLRENYGDFTVLGDWDARSIHTYMAFLTEKQAMQVKNVRINFDASPAIHSKQLDWHEAI
jgi:hypothetical protein